MDCRSDDDCFFCRRRLARCRTLLPADDQIIKEGDRLLVCAGRGGFTRLNWNLQQEHILRYVRTGKTRKHGWLWRKLSGRD